MVNKSFIGLSTFQFLAYFRRGLFYSFLSIYLYYFLGLSITFSSFFVTFSMIASSIGQAFIWGRLSDRLFNRKIMVFLSELIAGIGHIIVWILHRVAYQYSPIYAAWTIIIGLTCIEVFWSASNVAWSALISDIISKEERSSVMGNLSGIGGLGRIFGVVSATIFLSFGGFRGGGFFYGYLFIITAVVISITALIILFTISDSDLKYRYESIEEKNDDSSIIPKSKINFDVKFFVIFLSALVFINFGRNAVNIIQDYFVIDKFAVSDSNLGIFEVMRSIFIIIAGFSTPFLIKKLGDWKVFLLSPIFVIFCFIGFIISPLMELAFFFGSMLWIAQVTIDASSYGIIASKIPSQLRGKYFGYYNTVFFLSWGMGTTLITGPISDHLISADFNSIYAYTVSYIAAAILVIIGLGIAIFLFLSTKKSKNSVVY